MRQSKRIFINTLSNWASIFTNALVLIFISKFLINKLGEAQFGILQYVLAIQASLVNLQLGLGATLNRYVSQLLEAGERKHLNAIISLSAWLLFVLGVVAGAAMIVMGFFLPSLIADCTEELHKEGFVLMLYMAGTLAVRFWGYAPTGVLLGSQRYDIANITRVVFSLARAGWIVVVLRGSTTANLREVGICFLGTSIFETVALWAFAGRQYGSLNLNPGLINKAVMKEVFGFSVGVLLLSVTTTLIISCPTFFTGPLLGADAVTFISLSVLLLSQIQQVSAGFAFSLIPVAGKYAGAQHTAILRDIANRGTRYCTIMCASIGGVALVFSHPLFGWFKPELKWTWVLLAIMMLPMIVRTTQRVTYSVLMGARSIRWLAIGQVVLLIIIAGLSYVLTVSFKMGLYGIALGWSIPVLLFSAIFQPLYACRQVGLGYVKYMWDSYALPMLAVIPAALAGLLFVKYLYPTTLPAIAAEGLVCLAVYGVTAWFVTVNASEKSRIIAFIQRKFLRIGLSGQ